MDTGKYPHPQGAKLTRATATTPDAVAADVTIDIYYAATALDAGTVIKTVTIPAGKNVGFAALGGQWMKPLESLVWAHTDTVPDGLMITVGFGR